MFGAWAVLLGACSGAPLYTSSRIEVSANSNRFSGLAVVRRVCFRSLCLENTSVTISDGYQNEKVCGHGL